MIRRSDIRVRNVTLKNSEEFCLAAQKYLRIEIVSFRLIQRAETALYDNAADSIQMRFKLLYSINYTPTRCRVIHDFRSAWERKQENEND